jgi:hypothetical protein
VESTKKKIMKASAVWLAAAIVAVMGVTSCNTMMPQKIQAVRKTVTKSQNYKLSEFGGPSDSTLAFGLSSVWSVYMLQVDPDLPPVHCSIGMAGTVPQSKLSNADLYQSFVFYLPPVAVGSKMVPTRMFINGANAYYYTSFPLNSKKTLAFEAAKPGLLYLGDYGTDFSGVFEGVKKLGSSNELVCLEKMLPQFKKTEWERVIVDRIKELSK